MTNATAPHTDEPRVENGGLMSEAATGTAEGGARSGGGVHDRADDGDAAGEAERTAAAIVWGSGVHVVRDRARNVADLDLHHLVVADGDRAAHRWCAFSGVCDAVVDGAPYRRQHESPRAFSRDHRGSRQRADLKGAGASDAVGLPQLMAGGEGV